MDDIIQKIISLHDSPQHTDRQKGRELVAGLRDPKLIRELDDSLSPKKHSGLRITLTGLMSKLLQNGDEEMLGLSLSILFRYATSAQKELRAESEKLLEEFFSNPSIFHLRKVYSIRASWRYLNSAERLIATRRIGVSQFREVLPITLENFLSEDPQLIILTTEVFRLLGDKRANRFIRTVLETKTDSRIIIKALEALSELGFFLDQKYFREYLRSADEEVAFAAARGLYRSQNERAISDLVGLFDRFQSDSMKLKVIELLISKPTEKSVTAVLELWQKAPLSTIEHKIEWALNELERNIKVQSLIKFFPRAQEPLQFKIISLLNEIHHPACFQFFAAVLVESKNDFIRISAMESLAFYDDEKSMEILRPFLKDHESYLHYYALAALVKHSKIDLRTYLEDIVDAGFSDDRHYHQLVLSVLQEHTSVQDLSQKLVDYCWRMLQSSSKDNRYLAFGVFARFHRQFDWNSVLSLAREEKDPLVFREARKGLARVFSLYPQEFLTGLGERALGLFEDRGFLAEITISDDVIRALFQGHHRQAIINLQELAGRQFWTHVSSYILEGELDLEQLTWVDLTAVSFEEFIQLWQLFLTRVRMRDHLLRSLSLSRNPRFGEFIMNEYLSGRSQEMHPYVSRFINGLP